MPAPKPSTPQEYIERQPEDRRSALIVLDRAIRTAAPSLKPKLWPETNNGMIGYGEFPYTFAGGREGTWFIVGLASKKQYLSLYISATNEDGYLVEQNKSRLGKVATGKSCINIKRIEDLNLPVAMELVRQAAELHGVRKR